ncbi:MAG: endonuclease/exonuclease/phosphatase family protein, partial [Acidobacteriota bacterium]|nr:endonuclease/exonuclease/phosphatase family protein [Acidobacteriota bacterium]
MRQTAVMVLWTLSLAAIVALGSDGDGRPATQVRRRPMRFRAEMSDMLTHSTLDTCRVDDASAQRAHQRVRVATWNIRAARSASVNAVADELKAIGADVIALQEVDVRTRRAGFVDQPEFLARALGFGYAFAASIKWDGGDYGL